MREPIERRRLIGAAAALGAAELLRPATALAAEKASEVNATEDLMREHGVLRRILLIYDETSRRIQTDKANAHMDVLAQSAGIIRHFIEDYH